MSSSGATRRTSGGGTVGRVTAERARTAEAKDAANDRYSSTLEFVENAARIQVCAVLVARD